MANILYGINGEGSGHWTRSIEIIRHLQNDGHDIRVATSGRALQNLKNQLLVEEIFGFRFSFTKGRVNQLKTFFKNTNVIPRAGLSVRKLSRIIKENKINLVITDFEPISCSAAHINGIPVISVDNQHFITRTRVKFPLRYLAEAGVVKAAIEMMVPGAEQYFALSFFEAETTSSNVSVFKPVLRKEIFNLRPYDGDHILVYVTHGSEELAQILNQIDHKFIFYGSNSDRNDQNVQFKRFDQNEFVKDLASSAGVFATAGFSLISEALYLGKPFLAWPVANQFEQIFNAYHIERLGYGGFIKRPVQEKIEAFLFNLPKYRRELEKYERQNNDKLFSALDNSISRLT